MVDVAGFRGLRYAPEYVNTTVFAPPYDVISPEQRLRYLASDPHNVVRLTLGPAPDDAPSFERGLLEPEEPGRLLCG